MLKAVILDFDGVVIDSELVWFDIYVDWLEKNLNYNLVMEEFLLCVGANYEKLFQALEQKNNFIIDREKFLIDTTQKFIDLSDQLPAKEGVVDFIKSVKDAGLKLSLATSAVRAKPIKHLTRFGLIDYFDFIVTADDVERIKPHPDLFLKALEKLNIEKEEAIIFEDSRNGVLAANRAGVKVIVVPNDVTKHSKHENYEDKVNSLSEVNIAKLVSNFK